MVRRTRYLILIVFSTFIFACEKEELPVPAHEAGDVITNNVKMESDYKYQLFFDLETNTMVKKNLKTDWDLGFETSDNGYQIILNTAKSMFIANTNQTSFSTIIDTSNLVFKWDAISGNLDSTAIGDWRTTQTIYVIDKGYNELGVHQGFSKIEFLSVNNSSYQIRFANLDGSGEVTMQIGKDNNYNFSYLSLDGGSIKDIEPSKEGWDLMFSQYTHIFKGTPRTPYLVTGALTNRNKVEVAQVFDLDFLDINRNHINQYTFSSDINRVGYDWKEYLFSSGSYIIFTDKNFIIKSTEGRYYKLHFINFYDDLGAKGSPTFEFQEL